MPKKKRLTEQEQRGRVRQILAGFDRAYADARCALRHESPLELLIATILSAQCTDDRVNQVTRALFQKYRTAADYAAAPAAILEQEIRPTGFFRNKAKSVQGACRLLLERFGGRVPDSMDDLMLLPGVARKTANVVLGVAFGKAAGIVVDTHVLRVARRLELTNSEKPEVVEQDLVKLIPKARWISFPLQTILHGRQTCKARRPLCPTCPVESVCRSEDKILAFPAVPSKGAKNAAGAGSKA
jgi:endonuclease-3